MRQQPVAVLLASILAISSVQAADTVRWEDLPKKIGQGNTHEYTIVIKDGAARKGYLLTFSAEFVQYSDLKPVIPREQVAEIRIRHHREMSDASAIPAATIVSKMNETDFVFLIPAMFVVFVATVPPAIAVEGIRRLLPGKVIKVAP